VTLLHDESPSGIRADYPEPLWIQAVNEIAGQIAAGTLVPGMRLAPERELCIQMGISRVTLRKALNRLVEDGLLRASHGRGWYVADAQGVQAGKEWPNTLESFTETAKRMGLVATSTVLKVEESAASLDEAERLQIAPGMLLFRLERVRLLGGVPIALDDSQIPTSLAAGLLDIDFSSSSLYDALAAKGVEPVRAEATIEAKEATATEADRLSLEPSKPLLVMRQLAFDWAERPLFLSTIRYAGDRYRLKTFFARRNPS
jgi:GntR family transcriptional regulator